MIIIAIILIIILFSYISTDNAPCNSEGDEIEELIILDEILGDDE